MIRIVFRSIFFFRLELDLFFVDAPNFSQLGVLRTNGQRNRGWDGISLTCKYSVEFVLFHSESNIEISLIIIKKKPSVVCYRPLVIVLFFNFQKTRSMSQWPLNIWWKIKKTVSNCYTIFLIVKILQSIWLLKNEIKFLNGSVAK